MSQPTYGPPDEPDQPCEARPQADDTLSTEALRSIARQDRTMGYPYSAQLLDAAADEIDRLRRMFGALAEVNGWRDGWMSRAAAEMHTVLDAHEQGQPIPDSAVQCMTALIAEWWDDGEADPDE